jgi:drug/metabolite transporter (DMT)-like permease
MMRSRAQVLVVLAVGVLAVSCAAIFIRLAEAPALSTAAYRLIFASVPSLALLPLRGRRELTKLAPGDWRLIGLSGACLALHFATWVASLEMTTVSSSVALVTTSPLFVAGFVALRGEKVSTGTIVAMVVCLAGGVVIGAADLGRGDRAVLGDLLAVAGAVFAAMYFALGRVLRPSMSVTTYIGVIYPLAALVMTALTLAGRQPLAGFNGRTYLMFLLMALGPQLIGHSSLNWALGYLSAPFVAIAVLGEPVISTALAAVFLSEMPGPLRLGGGLIVLIGVYIGLKAEIQQPPSPAVLTTGDADYSPA